MKGYFIHNLPDEIPSNYDFCFVRSRIGVNPDLTLDKNWHNTRYLSRGLYQFPKPTADDDVYEHSSIMVQDSWYYPDAKWIVLCGLYVDLQWINMWVGKIADQTDMLPVVYTTYNNWDAITTGPNAESVVSAITTKGRLCMSKYGVQKPILPKYTNKLYFWEHAQNKILYEPAGLEVDSGFNYGDEPGTDPIEPDPPVEPPVVITPPKKWRIVGQVSTYEPRLFGGERKRIDHYYDLTVEAEE